MNPVAFDSLFFTSFLMNVLSGSAEHEAHHVFMGDLSCNVTWMQWLFETPEPAVALTLTVVLCGC